MNECEAEYHREGIWGMLMDLFFQKRFFGREKIRGEIENQLLFD
jgi:hypothetical protein